MGDVEYVQHGNDADVVLANGAGGAVGLEDGDGEGGEIVGDESVDGVGEGGKVGNLDELLFVEMRDLRRCIEGWECMLCWGELDCATG